MRSADAATINALYDVPEKGLVARDFVWLSVKDIEGDPQTFGFWNDLDTYDLNVISGETGNEVNRTYVGGGTLRSISPIKLTTGLVIKRVSVTLSGIHPTVQDMARGHRLKLGKVEIHRGIFDPASRLLVAAPRLHFMGQVNDADFATPAVGGEGGVTLECLGQTIDLTRTNPAKRSDASQRRRSGDRFYRYADIMGEVTIPWGEK